MVLSSSSQTELKACLSSKSLCVFLLQMETSRWNWTRTVRGQLNEGGEAAAGTWDAAPCFLEPSGEVAAGRGVNVAVGGALQVPIRPEEADTSQGGHRAVGRRAPAEHSRQSHIPKGHLW